MKIYKQQVLPHIQTISPPHQRRVIKGDGMRRQLWSHSAIIRGVGATQQKDGLLHEKWF